VVEAIGDSPVSPTPDATETASTAVGDPAGAVVLSPVAPPPLQQQ
jgi:hypothetical protein